MNIDEMHYRFRVGLDKVDTQDRPDFYPNEIDNFLNRAILEFVKSRYKESYKTKRAFETDHDRVSALMSLHVDSPLIQAGLVPTNVNSSGVYKVELSDLDFPFMYPTKIEIQASKSSCPSKTIRWKSWQTDDLKTVYTQPSFEFGRLLVTFIKSSDTAIPSMLRLDTTNKQGVSQYTIDTAYISYIKEPARVCLGTYKHIDDDSASATTTIQHCDIHSSYHDEIVNEAVLMASRSIQDQFNYQTSMQRTQTDINNRS